MLSSPCCPRTVPRRVRLSRVSVLLFLKKRLSCGLERTRFNVVFTLVITSETYPFVDVIGDN